METKPLVQWLSEIEDPRTGPAKLHELGELLVVAICAVLAGADHCADIALGGRLKLEWLRGFLKLQNGVPSHDTFSRVLRLLEPKKFEAVFRDWVRGVVGALGGRVVIDGKTLRGSHDGNAKAIHMVSAFATTLGLVVGQEAVSQKSNEITAIPALLEALLLKGCLVSIDALGCQKAIARTIRRQGADYLLAVKGNQGNLEQAVVEFFDAARCDRLKLPNSYLETVEKAHGRIETRRYWVTDNVFGLVDQTLWQDCRKVGLVESIRQASAGKGELERRYFISSAALEVTGFARAVRDHWHIENRLHWSLDVIFGEDGSRIRKDHGPQNFGLLRKLALNLLRMDISNPKTNLRQQRQRATWDDRFLASVLGLNPVG